MHAASLIGQLMRNPDVYDRLREVGFEDDAIPR